MKRNTVEVFHALMKKGWVDRRDNPEIWSMLEDQDVLEELDDFKAGMGIDIIRVGDRIYMVPTQDNDLFLKNNVDYRSDISAGNEVRTRDLYLFNYLSIYLIYLFFSGEGSDPCSREFLKKSELVSLFTTHCENVTSDVIGERSQTEYSDNFIALANAWLSKLDGDPASKKFDQKYGIVNRLMVKYKNDELFELSDDDLIRPTRKLKDLMPYFLRKDRVSDIQNWIKEADSDAADK